MPVLRALSRAARVPSGVCGPVDFLGIQAILFDLFFSGHKWKEHRI
jgi:hypothetical protein